MLPFIALINGQPQSHCSVLDRGLAYGDGLFETLAIHQRHPVLLARHLARLAEGCRRLAIPFDDALAARLRTELESLCQTFPESEAVAKIILTRGGGGRGYRVSEPLAPTRILTLSPRPVYPPAHWQQGIELGLCATRLGINPALAGVKHLNRLEQVLARAEWDDEFAEGVVLDYEGRVVEGTMSNLFAVVDDRLQTPGLHRCGVAGVMRGLIIDQARVQGVNVEVVDLAVEDLVAADALLVCNSLIGAWPVRRFLDRDYASSSWHRTIQHWITRGESTPC